MFAMTEIGKAGVIGIVLLAAASGCRDSSTGQEARAGTSSRVAADDHGHRAGAHGGRIVPIDGAHYHVEAILTEGDGLRLLTLGEDESRVQEVDSQTLTAYVRARDESHARTVKLEPEAQAGDAPGTTSAFAGRLPGGLSGKALVVVVPSIRIGGHRLHFGFELDAPEPAAAMPEKVADEDERRLYLSPGGKYTEADIAANGRTTASVKFAGFRAAHDPHPAPGSPVCPITDTRADPKCSWIVGGKTYTFCCPPCVDEFVRRAKEEPGTIREPEAYVMPREEDGNP